MKSKSNSLFNIFMDEINVLTVHTSDNQFSSKAFGDLDAADKQILENNGYSRQSNGDYINHHASINDVANATSGCAKNHKNQKQNPKVVKKEGEGSLLMRIIYVLVAAVILFYLVKG